MTLMTAPAVGRHLYVVLGISTRAVGLPDCCSGKLRSVHERKGGPFEEWCPSTRPPSPSHPVIDNDEG